MTRRFLILLSVSAMALSVPVLAQENDGTIPAHQVAGAAHKPVSEMNAQERAAFWANLPQADKDRILKLRAQQDADEKAARMNKDQDYPGDPSNKTITVPPTNAEVQRYEQLDGQRQQSAKASWEAMSPDEKRAFFEVHRAEIEAAIAKRQGTQ